MSDFGFAPLKAEGSKVPFDREATGPSHVEPTIEPDTAVHRLAFALCDALNDTYPYETPYRCVALAERLIAKGLAFDPVALDATQRPNRGT